MTIVIPAKETAELRDLLESARRKRDASGVSPQAFGAARRQLLATLPEEGDATIPMPLAEKATAILVVSRSDLHDPHIRSRFTNRRYALLDILYRLIEDAKA